jgi:hypothetical protein
MPHTHDAGLPGCFPSLTGHAEFVHDGWDSLVALADDRWIARVPRTPRTARRAAKEISLLELLADRWPTEVPEPLEVCSQHGSMLYRRIARRTAPAGRRRYGSAPDRV